MTALTSTPDAKPDLEADSQESALWAEWLLHRAAAVRASIFFFYADWIRIVASSFFARYSHPMAEWQDYVQFASVGVLKAIDRFDPAIQPSFKAFADTYIKGEILKGISCFTKDSKYKPDAKAMIGFSSHYDESDLYGLEEIVEVAVGLAFGCFLELGVEDFTPVNNDPLSVYEGDRQFGSLMSYVERLSEREREVIVAHYFQHLAFSEIADLLELSKPRVTQIHQKALLRIRQWYEEDTDAQESFF